MRILELEDNGLDVSLLQDSLRNAGFNPGITEHRFTMS